MLACYVVNTNADDTSGRKKCYPMLEDYYECLHHRKEVRERNTPLSLAQPSPLAQEQHVPGRRQRLL